MKSAEMRHQKTVESKILEMRDALVTGKDVSVSIPGSAEMPRLPVFIIPPGTSTSLKYEIRQVSIDVEYTKPDGEVQNVTIDECHTISIFVSPIYHYMMSPEYVIEHGVIFVRYGENIVNLTAVPFTRERI